MRRNYTNEEVLVKDVLKAGCKEIVNNSNVNRCFDRLRDFSEELKRHSINVAILSSIIGIYANNSLSNIRDLFISGLLHDYGKLFIPRTILNKSDRLTLLERKEIENHVLLGYENLRKEKSLNNNILLGALEHHERMDGTGYIGGKSEESISELAKIIMIADVYDAMISDRVYRTRIDRGIVYEYLFSNAGRHFNRNLIKCFINNTLSMDLDYVIYEIENNIFDCDRLEVLKAVIK